MAPSVRVAACKRVTDEGVLARLARYESDSAVAGQIVGLVQDERLLAEIASEASNGTLREAALERVHSQTMLGNIAQHSRHAGSRHAAAKRVTEEGVLTAILQHTTYADARRDAATRLTDAQMVASLTNQTALVEVALWGKTPEIHQTAERALEDKTILDALVEDNLLRLQTSAGPRRTNRQSEDIRREAADVLIRIATSMPHLLRDKWSMLAKTIDHTDEQIHEGCHAYTWSKNHPDQCHRDSVSHRDRGPAAFRGLKFPNKPADF